jgi:hypothetical protein
LSRYGIDTFRYNYLFLLIFLGDVADKSFRHVVCDHFQCRTGFQAHRESTQKKSVRAGAQLPDRSRFYDALATGGG